MAYWDTSALVKVYIDEPDSRRYREILQTGNQELHTSTLSLAELYKTFWAKSINGALVSRGPDVLIQRISEAAQRGDIRLIPYDRALLPQFQAVTATCYSQPRPLRLRSADGIHLASARLAAAIDLVCADKRMRAAAAILGFHLLPETI